MQRNPLYLNTVEGGLSPVTSPDNINPSIIPPLFEQRFSATSNRNYFVVDSPAHKLIPVNHSSVSELVEGMVDSADLIYRAVAITPDESYYFASVEAGDKVVALCLGVVAFNSVDYVVLQTHGVIKPIVSVGLVDAIAFPTDEPIYYLASDGFLSTTPSTIQVTNHQTIDVKMTAPLVSQAIVSGGIVSSAGLIVTAQAGTTVTIGDGAVTHTINYTTPTTLATVPASTTTHLYLEPDGTVTASTKPYMVVPTETNLEVTKLLGEVTTATKSSNVVVSGSTIKSTATSSWGACYFSNDSASSYQYYQFTCSGVSNTMVGVGAVNAGTVMANNSLNNASGVTQLVYLSMTTSSTAFAKHGSASLWTLHSTTAPTVSGTKVHAVLLDQISKQVYWAIDGVWLNSGQALATYAGTDKLAVIFSVANNTVYVTFNTPTTITLPSGFAESYYYYDKSTNVSYSYPTPTTIAYEPRMYLGKVVSASSDVTSITSPPINNTYVEEVYLSELTAINHNLFAFAPQITFNQEPRVTYTVSSNPQTAYLSANGSTFYNTTVTATT